MVDVAVMGAGVMGLCCGFALARRGAEVLVVEVARPGAGASGGLVGALVPHAPLPWSEVKEAQLEALIYAESFWADVRAVSGVDPGYARVGRLEPLSDETTRARAELLAEAAARIKANPERYIDYIYGKDEVGGTSVLYLSDVPFEDLGFRMDLPKEPLPKYTGQVMSNLPALVVGLAVALGTTTIATRRSANGNGNKNGNGHGQASVPVTNTEKNEGGQS